MKIITFMCMVIIMLSIIDITTTIHLRDMGFVEMNPHVAPFLHSVVTLIALKMFGLISCYLIYIFSMKFIETFECSEKWRSLYSRVFGNLHFGTVVIVSGIVCINNIKYMVII